MPCELKLILLIINIKNKKMNIKYFRKLRKTFRNLCRMNIVLYISRI